MIIPCLNHVPSLSLQVYSRARTFSGPTQSKDLEHVLHIWRGTAILLVLQWKEVVANSGDPKTTTQTWWRQGELHWIVVERGNHTWAWLSPSGQPGFLFQVPAMQTRACQEAQEIGKELVCYDTLYLLVLEFSSYQFLLFITWKSLFLGLLVAFHRNHALEKGYC